MAFKMAGFSGPFKKPLVGNQHKLPEEVKQGILDAPMKQTAAGTEDASPGGGTPPKLKKKAKTIAQRIKDLELHKQTNTKEYKDLIAQVNKGYSEQGNYDEVD